MFSYEEKRIIAQKVEELILSLNHPEMPKERPIFVLNVLGKESWSYAQIEPNWKFEDKPAGMNPWNEIAREVMPEKP